jgi:predicted O-methyltransferase YrrM
VPDLNLTLDMVKIALRYLNYFLNAVDEHSLHSPYIYNLYSNIIKPDQDHQEFAPYKSVRKELAKDSRMIKIHDLGAGSAINSCPERKLKAIVKRGTTPSKQSRLFYRIIRHFQFRNIVELGSSVGINTLYMASANKEGQVYTLEGCPNTAMIADEVFSRFRNLNIHLIQGSIDQVLPNLVKKLPALDFVYFDANHTFDATLKYFTMCLPKIHENTVFVFDDIYWSSGMEKAWNIIKNHDRVSLTIDLFDSGMVIFKPLYVKQHYVLSY